ncbi:Gfo/Idh/MocA family oxidoreductase [Blautia liquoris]|uniref:Gfo/Idh/MocA family oxidoreductase n=1 Tax=Blautia liquoris TaxID=2779518 RepID=A0A7M2REV5_9FIRM|nr:Gfo/Idh/MocA family oxidoreductase [Blautia liquoris]QOV18678.1 Gfo/Idh/MocA family oxidoreductase [Blautia liquoris]
MEHKIAIIGFGGMGHWHYDLIQKIDDLSISGIYDIDEKQQKDAEDKGLRVYKDLDELLDDQRSDLVLVATPNDLHKKLSILSLESGKNVVCEKPAAISSVEVQEMIDAANCTGKFLTIHQNRRWDQDYKMVRDLIKTDKLGGLWRIESRVHGSIGIPADHWRQFQEHGGGMVLDWGVHLFDQITQMFRGEKIKKVYAALTHVTNLMVDDGFTVELTMESGVVALVEAGTSNFISLPRWYVLGSEGTAEIKNFAQKGEIVCARGNGADDVMPVLTAAGPTKTMAPRREENIHREELPLIESDIREFYQNVMRVIEGKEESLIKMTEVKRVMQLMEAVFESGETGEPVYFES